MQGTPKPPVFYWTTTTTTSDGMDMKPDHPSFDLQSRHLSFEERRWLAKQRQLCQLDGLIEFIVKLHETIKGHEHISLIPSPWTSSASIDQVKLDGMQPLYYTSVLDGATDNRIDLFRLRHQHKFQQTFHDFSLDRNYRLFFIIVEGLIFYSSATVSDYTSAFMEEYRQFLWSVPDYVRRRATQLRELLAWLTQSTLPTYSYGHTVDQNNCGILFQVLPKVSYPIDTKSPCKSIVLADEYAKHVLSPEELRYLDYAMQTTARSPRQRAALPARRSTVTPSTEVPLEIHHSLPIMYPYDNASVYDGTYPSFWTGTHHVDAHGDALFQAISLERASAEYVFAERFFHKTASRSKFNIVAIERVQNPHLWEKFRSHRSYMRRKNGSGYLHEEWLFHGTQSQNHDRILSHGFNRAFCRDSVYYGRGVYFSRDASYSSRYGDQNDLSFVLICRILVGQHLPGSNGMHVAPNITLPTGKVIQADSTTDHTTPFTIACTYHDDQNYPEYIVSYTRRPVESPTGAPAHLFPFR